MAEYQNELSNSQELTDISKNEATWSTPIRGNGEETYATTTKGNNEATFITPMQSGNEATFVTPLPGNNQETYATTTKGNNEATFITAANSQNEHIDLIATKPMRAVPAPPAPQRLNIDRRKLLLGGGASLLVLAAGGTALTMALNNTHQRSTPDSVVPTVVPKPRALMPGKIVLTIAGHNDTVTNVLWDPTGRYLASSSLDNSIKLWDVGNVLQKQTAEPLTLSRFAWGLLFKDAADFGFDTLHWSADGRKLITLVFNKNYSANPYLLSPFTSNTKGQLFTYVIKGRNDRPDADTPAPAPRGTMLATIDRQVRRYLKVDLWQMSKPKAPVASLIYQDPVQFVGDVAFLNIIGWSCDGTLLAGLTGTGNLVIWDVRTHGVKAVIPLKKAGNEQVSRITLSWSPVNPHLLAASNIGTIAVVDVNQRKVLYQLSTDDAGALKPITGSDHDTWPPHVVAITWSPDGRYIAGSYASSNKVYLWDTQAKNAPTKDGIRLQQLIFPQANDPLAHRYSITDISWSPDGRFLATGSYDKSIKVWKVDGHA